MNKRHYEHTLPNIRGSLSNTYHDSNPLLLKIECVPIMRLSMISGIIMPQARYK